MATDVDVANQALSLLGAKTITAFDDGTNEAIQINANYASVRDAVLEEAAWTWADSSLVLDDPIDGGWETGDKLYELPEGVIRVYRVYQRVDLQTPVQLEGWRREGNYIRAKYSGTIYAIATMRIEAVDDWSPGFRQTMTTRLAAEIAISITRSRKMYEDLFRIYETKLRAAVAADSGQARSERTDSTELVRARFVDGLQGIR